MKLRLILLVLFLPLFAVAQLTEEVNILYTDLNTPEIAASNYIGKSCAANPFDSKFAPIAQIASDDDLFYIAMNGIPLLQNYSMTELVNRKSQNLRDLFSKFLSSDEKFMVVNGNQTFESTPAAQLYKSIAWQKEKSERKAYYETTTRKALITELKQLFGADYDTKWTIRQTDSLMSVYAQLALANDDSAPQTLNAIFRTNNFKSANYNRVKFFAVKYPTSEILATLASFKNKNDLPLLHKNIDNAFLAISRFPHPTFLPALKNKVNLQFENPEFQQAITAFCNKESITILETMRKKIAANNPDLGKEKLFLLYGIIEKRNSPLYTALLLRIEKTI